jgi:uncharacterized protein (DUF302 family)
VDTAALVVTVHETVAYSGKEHEAELTSVVHRSSHIRRLLPIKYSRDGSERNNPMTTIQVTVQRFTLVSPKPFESILQMLEAEIGHPDMSRFAREVTAAGSYGELEEIVQEAIGSSGLMEFTRFNLGEIIRKEHGPGSPRILRLVVGNPLIMKQMAVHVHDVASYAPVNILIDERADGVHLSYDRMASLLAPYGSAEAQQVAETLDAKIEGLLQAAAA